MLVDDFSFSCVMERSDENVIYTNRRIDSIFELVTSMYNHRLLVPWGNGRMSDKMCQLLLYMGGGKGVLTSVLSSVIAFFYVFSYSKLCFGRVNVACSSLVICASFLFLPCIEGTVFWLSGSLNYLWGGLWLGLFLLLFQKQKENDSKSSLLALCVISFICGSWHECLGGAMSFSVFCLAVNEYRSKGVLPRYFVLSLVCLMIGLSVCVSSPGIWARAGGSVNSNYLTDLIISLAYMLRHSLLVMIAFVVVLFLKKFPLSSHR